MKSCVYRGAFLYEFIYKKMDIEYNESKRGERVYG